MGRRYDTCAAPGERRRTHRKDRMNTDKRVMILNQIAAFYRRKPADQAASEIALHVERFWELRIRQQAYANLDAGGARLETNAAVALALPRGRKTGRVSFDPADKAALSSPLEVWGRRRSARVRCRGRVVSGLERLQGRKACFFEKRQQKTFVSAVAECPASHTPGAKLCFWERLVVLAMTAATCGLGLSASKRSSA